MTYYLKLLIWDRRKLTLVTERQVSEANNATSTAPSAPSNLAVAPPLEADQLEAPASQHIIEEEK